MYDCVYVCSAFGSDWRSLLCCVVCVCVVCVHVCMCVLPSEATGEAHGGEVCVDVVCVHMSLWMICFG